MDNIDIYFESIRQVYEQIINWKRPKDPLLNRISLTLTVTLAIAFVASVIPIIPTLVVLLGGQLNLNLLSIELAEASIIDFTMIWGGLTLVTLLLMVLLISVQGRVDSKSENLIRPPYSLSLEQVTFLSLYESYKELNIYFVSHVEQHISNSVSALNRVLHPDPGNPQPHEREEVNLTYLEQELKVMNSGPDSRRYSWRRGSELMRQVQAASNFLNTFERYAWFQLDPETKSILQAMISLEGKIRPRLENKQDLPRVLSILENFSKAQYAFLPEHYTNMDVDTLSQLQTEGENCLRVFVEEINELTAYKGKESSQNDKQKIAPRLFEKIKKKFPESVFLRFSVWFLLILTLTSGALILIDLAYPLSPDTMATVIIGTSVASAAALAGFLPQNTNRS